VPRLTKEGFKVVPAPSKVFAELRAAYDTLSKQHATPEHENIDPTHGLQPVMHSKASDILREGHYAVPSTVTDLKKWGDPALMDRTVEAVKDVLEGWAGTPIEHTQSYGVRSYQRGAVLRRHVDRIATHALSVIINVGQSGMEQRWPLQIQDHGGAWRETYLQPGEMLMYESAKLQHERSYPLNGTSYANLFINYRPSDWIHKGTMFTKDGRLGFASKAAHDTYYRKVRHAGMPSSPSWAIPAAVACACALVAFLWRRRSTKGALPKGSGATKQQSRGGKKRR
jgi:prolyl 4-hydroxylase